MLRYCQIFVFRIVLRYSNDTSLNSLEISSQCFILRYFRLILLQRRRICNQWCRRGCLLRTSWKPWVLFWKRRRIHLLQVSY